MNFTSKLMFFKNHTHLSLLFVKVGTRVLITDSISVSKGPRGDFVGGGMMRGGMVRGWMVRGGGSGRGGEGRGHEGRSDKDNLKCKNDKNKHDFSCS